VRFTVGRTLDGPYRSFILRFCHAGLLISLIAIPFISSLTSSILIAIGFGLSYGLIYPSLNAEVLTICPAQHRGKVSGALTLVFETGFRGYAPIAGSLIVLSGYSALFWTTALIYLAGLFIYYLHKRHLSL
jgi:predicted MFS family arabinose efflux permease